MSDAVKLTPELERAIDALCEFSHAMHKGNLTAFDLACGLRLIISSGHETLALDLAMASQALELADVGVKP